MSYFSLIVTAIAACLLQPTLAGPVKAPAQATDATQEVTICDLKKTPAAFNHKLVKLTGFVSHGFEDFGVYDPECSDWPQIWLEYGGDKGSDTMYCCGVTPKQQRSTDVTVENIKIPLVGDDQFNQFNKIIEKERNSTIHATIIGRFFSGKQEKYPNGKTGWSGYGHMGCCSLLVIQQVVSVDSHDRTDLDYGSSSDQPNIDKVGCGYEILSRDWRFSQALNLQRKAESEDRAWALDDPARVAREVIARESGNPEASINLTIARTAPGRMVYTWKPAKTKTTYMVVVSRPYTLSFYAKDSKKVSWMPVAAYKAGCDRDNATKRIK
jgi:hypothetical protein